MKDDLRDSSIRLILANQHPSGSYVACPLYFHYAYCWLRDGTFTAYAMDLCGEHDSARRFYGWAHRVVEGQKDRIRDLIGKRRRGKGIAQDAFLNTRYHLDGQADEAPWGHFQLDGYGTLLWGMERHSALTADRSVIDNWRSSIEASVDYVRTFWRNPNFDCWEESGDQVHPSTLACLYGGLQAAGSMLGRPDCTSVAQEIRQYVESKAAPKGFFIKSLHPNGSPAQTGVDASLLWLLQPFQMFEAEHPAMEKTVEEIRRTLATGGGGVRRYAEDRYYGGGEWILLTAWLGWIDATAGKRAEAEEAMTWIKRQADALGRLPEQVDGPNTKTEDRKDWTRRLGPPALPLLWSHAMALVLEKVLAGHQGNS